MRHMPEAAFSEEVGEEHVVRVIPAIDQSISSCTHAPMGNTQSCISRRSRTTPSRTTAQSHAARTPESYPAQFHTTPTSEGHPQLPLIRFRVLVIGRANAGKTSILQRICETTESPTIYRGNKEVRGPSFCLQVGFYSLR